ncbi:hypothetical protein BS50DRAFT_104727 [Corynespora cassiicola Philippines]|uniref:Uncharacterized protein n=1 Tax=Corynespora cassiicola Philippines TaxID=1448308 RepID=A0A2T2NCG3_CORCC|nr:hypothetical protein BS50DRAFT_104727 [Corynespora cassiicola Philippines]
MEAEPLMEVFGLCTGIVLYSEESCELIVFKRCLVRLPPFVELLREVARLASLEMVIVREGKLVSLEPKPGVGRHSAKASCGVRTDSMAFPLSADFFSFFSISFWATLRLLAPLADMADNGNDASFPGMILVADPIGPVSRWRCRWRVGMDVYPD